MSSVHHAGIWTVWGYPDDPDWDGETYDIGYTTDSGTATMVATGLCWSARASHRAKHRREMMGRKRQCASLS